MRNDRRPNIHLRFEPDEWGEIEEALEEAKVTGVRSRNALLTTWIRDRLRARGVEKHKLKIREAKNFKGRK